MFIKLRNIKLPIDSDPNSLIINSADSLSIRAKDIEKLSIFRKSLDARKARELSYTYTVDVWLKPGVKYKLPKDGERIEKEFSYEIPTLELKGKRPVIVGFGPCGMFCALVLARAGLKPIVFERGCEMEQRISDVEQFFATGKLNTGSNIQFGEGGAGTFSDGKLNTLVKDKDGRGRFVLHELVKAGADEEILYINKPHVGTDRLRSSMQNIRKEIIALGGEVHFNHQLIKISEDNGRLQGIIVKHQEQEISVDCDSLFLAIGHSARDTFIMLNKQGVALERKPFAVGVRIEHKQSMINNVQYHGAVNPLLPAADYKLVCHTDTGRTVYTFCMCPGGEVVAAASEENMVVTNGMSNFARDGENANSALLVEVRPGDFDGDDVLAGMYFQRDLEHKAYLAGGGAYVAPAQVVGNFLKTTNKNENTDITPTYSRGVHFTDLENVLPEFVVTALREGIVHFGKLIKGFDSPSAVLTAVESRSSSPVRIIRNSDNLQGSITGLYPIGEGAGYAGGIMSAAMDGMKAAEMYIKNLQA